MLYKHSFGTLRMLGEGYDKAAMKKTQDYECQKCFRDGRASVYDDLRWRHVIYN
jgi:hypothetical protein